MSLAQKLLKNSKLKHTAILNKSKVYGNKEVVTTPIPGINIALSGEVDGGLSPGLFMIAGKSRHFKTSYALIMAAAFQRKYPEGFVIFYDSEFGSPQDYFEAAGVDGDRVIHTPITDVEELSFDMMAQLNGIEKGDKVMFIIDSIGNLASKREVENALKENSALDMTRAKSLKGHWRMITPHLNLKDLSCIAINHTYDTQEMYSQEVVSGGQGGILSSDNIWTIGRQQEKDTKTGLKGWNFIINIYKSRYVKEKLKIPITVLFDGGVYKWSGLWEMALESGHLVKVNNMKYQWVDTRTGEVQAEGSRKTLERDEHMENLIRNVDFKDFVREKYRVVHDKLISEDSSVFDGDDEDDVIEE